jgi:2',3'-cyclic-nucleotide 2'-phosphodiesterase / 3'-nucleotidase
VDGTIPRRRNPALASILSLLLLLVIALPAAAQPTNPRAIANHTAEITVMGTSDVHSYVLNWDYFNDRPFPPGSAGEPGLAKVATIVDQVRADRGADATLLVDNGDTIQGSMLADYVAKVEPFTETGAMHPMALTMNAMGYDAMVVGNHEFNFGVPFLRAFEAQVDFPLLGANVRDAVTGDAAFTPYTIETINLKGHKPIRVGLLGLTTPGSSIWDRDKVAGILDFQDGVAAAHTYVPKMRAAGADVVVVMAHSGIDAGSSYGDAIPELENFAGVIAAEVPGIDAIFTAHSHRAVPEQYITNTTTGRQVLLSQPGSWARNLSVIDLELRMVRGQWTVVDMAAQLMSATGVPERADIISMVQPTHDATVAYVNSVIGTSLEEMSMSAARYRDVAALDFVNHVQTEAVRAGLVGTPHEGMPVLSIAAPFNRDARIPAGEVSIRDVAGIYIYDNTLLGIELTGAQLKDYLERSAQFFKTPVGPGPYAPDEVSGNGPDYNYDVISGLTYDIDISQPPGSRVVNLGYGGMPIDPDMRFAVAINNYRQNGGGGFPHVVGAPILYNPLTEIRGMIIEWVQDVGIIDPAEFYSVDWQLVTGGEPVVVIP